MKNIVYLCLTYVLLYTTATTAKTNYKITKYRSDYQYIKEIDGYVKFQEIPVTWTQANIHCQLEGAKILSPLNEEMPKVFQKFSEIPRRFHTGFYTYFNGYFRSMEGIQLSEIPHRWEPGQPDNKDSKENCIAYQNGLFSDVNCDEKYPYICYRLANMTILNECGTVDNGYNYSNVTGRCYRLYSFRDDWRSALRTCSAEDGHLLIINSDEEAGVVYEMFKILNSRSNIQLYHYGIREFSGHGHWATIFGDSLKTTGYEFLEPDTFPEDHSCGTIDRSLKVKKGKCLTLLPFICEKNAL